MEWIRSCNPQSSGTCLDHLDPVKFQLDVDVGDPARSHAAVVRSHGPEPTPLVADRGHERVVGNPMRRKFKLRTLTSRAMGTLRWIGKEVERWTWTRWRQVTRRSNGGPEEEDGDNKGKGGEERLVEVEAEEVLVRERREGGR